MAPVAPFEIDAGTVQVDPDGEQAVKVEFRLTVLPVEFVRLNVIVSAACAVVARPSAAKKAATIKPDFFIMNPLENSLLVDRITKEKQRKVAIHYIGRSLLNTDVSDIFSWSNSHRGDRVAGGLTFTNTAATRAHPSIAEIAAIPDPATRAKTLFDYLQNWVPPGEVEVPTPPQFPTALGWVPNLLAALGVH